MPVTADDLVALVRVHADRVHDLVRRLGCPPPAAPGVVEASALDLVAVAAWGPAVAGALVGRWFALAVEHAHRVGLDGAWLPRGSGPLADDAQQDLLAAGLERRAERSRSALLLRDAYDLPGFVVAVALGLDQRVAERVVGAARLELLPDVFDSASPAPPPHPVDDAALAGLATGPPSSREQSRAARHVRACGACSDVVVAQDDVRRLLAGLAVVALPDRTREQLLERVAARARADLPAALAVAAARRLRRAAGPAARSPAAAR